MMIRSFMPICYLHCPLSPASRTPCSPLLLASMKTPTARRFSLSVVVLALTALQSHAFILQQPFHNSRTLSVLHAGDGAGLIVDQVMEEMKVSMKAKDTVTLGTIRLMRAAFANAAIEARTEKLTDEQAIAALKKMAKMRLDSIDMFTAGGALDRADIERAELGVIGRWLPATADEATTRQWVLEAIQQVGDPPNLGKSMGALMKAHKAEIDGAMAQKILKEEVAKLSS
jgi:uncharacterized protein YqeY